MKVRLNGRELFIPMYNPEGGGAGGGAGGVDGGGDGGGAGGGTGASGGQPFATFPDEASFNARINREAKKQFGELLKGLGFEKEDDLKALVQKQKDAEDKSKTDLEKAQDVATQAQRDKDAAIQTANNRLIQAEVKLQSIALGVVDPDAAYALMAKDSVKVGDDGSVTGVKEALEALVKEKPYLKGQVTKTTVGGGSNPGGGTGELSDEEWGRKQAEERQKQSTSAGAYDPWAK